MAEKWTTFAQLGVLCAACALGATALCADAAKPDHHHHDEANPQHQNMHHTEQAPGYHTMAGT